MYGETERLMFLWLLGYFIHHLYSERQFLWESKSSLDIHECD